MQPTEALQERAQSYPHRPPAAVESQELGVEKTLAPRRDGESEPPTTLLAPLLSGNFVSAQYESDCARFVSEAKRLARRRAEAALDRPSFGS
jgi:hypothetical protein